MEEASHTSDRSMSWRDWSRDRKGTAVLTLFLVVVGLVLAGIARDLYKDQVEFGLSWGTYVPTALAVVVLAAALASGLRTLQLYRRQEHERPAALRAGSLPERAEHAAAVLQEATTLVEETIRRVNDIVDQALKRRLDDFERVARQREWLIGTVVALAIGFIAILAAHFILGF
jgi:hypothetical protein